MERIPIEQPDFTIPSESLALIREEVQAAGLTGGKLTISSLGGDTASLAWQGPAQQPVIRRADFDELRTTHEATQMFLIKWFGRRQT